MLIQICSSRRLESYMEYLAAFTAAHGKPSTLSYDYTSPLTGQPDRFVRLPGVACEHAMVRCDQSSGKLNRQQFIYCCVLN